jgi:hypothetical protein
MEIQKYRQMSNSHRMDNRNTRKCLRNNIKTMKYKLKCENGKEIDMTSYINLQMEDKLTRQDVLDRIEFYKLTNKL